MAEPSSHRPPQFVPLEARDPKLILPLIKRSVSISEDVIQLSESDEPVLEPLLGDLYISYVFDLQGLFKFVSKKDCEAFQLKSSDLRALSVRNLVRSRPSPQLARTKTCLMLRLDGDLEASLLLVDRLWEGLAPRLAGDIVAAVPARDVLAVTGSDVPYGTDILQNAVNDVWNSPTASEKLLLTKSLLLREGASWRALS